MTMGSCCDVISDEREDREEKREKGKDEEEERIVTIGAYMRYKKYPSICLTN